MTIKFKVTSGPAQSFLLFAQIIVIVNQVPSLRPLSDKSSLFLRIHTFIFAFFGMFFFHLDEISFCPWKGATPLHVITLRYVTTLFIVVFLASFVVLANHKSFQAVFTRGSCFCPVKFQNVIRKTKLFKNSLVHGITTFLILTYSQYTLTSALLLSTNTLYQEGRTMKQLFVYVQGSVEYFGVDHLPYAIPAVLVLVFLSLPPPLLLISYPLLWKIKAKLRRNVETDNDTTVWPIRKLLPLIDSFQGVFRDNCRMFAGLLFLWRLILTGFGVYSTDITQFYFMMATAIIVIFTIHTFAKPYKKRLDNMFDKLMLANLAIIVLLKWYISIPSTANISKPVVEFLVFFLMYLPLIALLAAVAFWHIRKLKTISITKEDGRNGVQSAIYTTKGDLC